MGEFEVRTVGDNSTGMEMLLIDRYWDFDNFVELARRNDERIAGSILMSRSQGS